MTDISRRSFVKKSIFTGMAVVSLRALNFCDDGIKPVSKSERKPRMIGKMGSQTGYVFDPVFLEHTYEGHVESADRLEAILQELNRSGVLSGLVQIPSRAVTNAELTLSHTEAMVSQIKEYSAQGVEFLDADTYLTRRSFEAASVAAGSGIDLNLAVIDGKLRNGFALLRPPGHHATSSKPMGFCLFNNIALAAKVAQKERGVERIAIVDIDVHHGNGTQAIFDADPDVLFISTHQYPFYPGTGSVLQTGKGAAEGSKINIPLSERTGDKDFDAIYGEIVIPVLKRFRPELILVSAGYDAHWKDPLAQLGLSLKGYSEIVNKLNTIANEFCNGKIVFFLEGGYNLQVLGFGVTNALKILCSRTDITDPLGNSPYAEPDIKDLIIKLKKIHSL
jgi:acetoin utilization deacetylase AcuC-like enzyme